MLPNSLSGGVSIHIMQWMWLHPHLISLFFFLNFILSRLDQFNRRFSIISVLSIFSPEDPELVLLLFVVDLLSSIRLDESKFPADLVSWFFVNAVNSSLNFPCVSLRGDAVLGSLGAKNPLEQPLLALSLLTLNGYFQLLTAMGLCQNVFCTTIFPTYPRFLICTILVNTDFSFAS